MCFGWKKLDGRLGLLGGYDELWAHEDLNGDGMPEVLKSHAWKVEFVGGNEGL